MDLLLVILIGVVAVAVVTTLAQRLGVAGPLLLVALGLAIGLMPFIDVPEIDPEWILVGILPPLLYAAAVRLPAIEFRRDFTPIAGLAVVLVVVTSLVLGLFLRCCCREWGSRSASRSARSSARRMPWRQGSRNASASRRAS